LPELIGRALLSNASSVIEVGVLQDKLHKLEHEHAHLSEEHAALSRMQVATFSNRNFLKTLSLISLRSWSFPSNS